MFSAEKQESLISCLPSDEFHCKLVNASWNSQQEVKYEMLMKSKAIEAFL